MKFFIPFRSQTFIIEIYLIDTLKTPVNMKVLLCVSIKWFRHSRWFEIKFWWGLYGNFKNHFFLILTLNWKSFNLACKLFQVSCSVIAKLEFTSWEWFILFCNFPVLFDRVFIYHVFQIFISAVGQQVFLKYFIELFVF